VDSVPGVGPRVSGRKTEILSGPISPNSDTGLNTFRAPANP